METTRGRKTRGAGSDRETMRNYEKRSTGPHEERCPKRETIFAREEGRRLEIDDDRQRRCIPGVFVRVVTNDGSDVLDER